MSRTDVRAVAEAVLSEPRVANALSVLSIGVAVWSGFLQRLIGWPGLIAMLVTLVLLMAGAVFSRRAEIRWHGVLPLSLLVFLGWASVSLIWSSYRWVTVSGVAYLLVFSVLGLAIALLRDTIQIVRAFGDVFRATLVVSFAIEIVAGLLIDTSLPFIGVQGDLDQLGPIQGIMLSRNHLGLIGLVALITFAIELRTRSISRGSAIGSIVLGAAGVLLSRSPVISTVAVVVVAAAGALYILRHLRADRRTPWQLAILAVALLAGVLAWVFRSQVIQVFSANRELSYRLTLWHRLWDLIQQNPLEGWGWASHWRPDVQPFPAFYVAGEREPTSAVNAYIDVWFQLGLVGLVLFLGLVVLTFTRSWLLAGRQRSVVFAWPALVLVALLITSLAESSILVEYGWVLFVVCSVKAAQELSWRTALTAASEEEDPPRPPGPIS